MERDIELIENYLQGNLSDQQKHELELRVEQDPVFAKRFQLLKNSFAALDPEIEAFIADLQEVQKEYRQTNRTFSWRKQAYRIAAAVVLISVVFLGYLGWFQGPNPQSLYLSYLEVPPNNITVRNEQIDKQIDLGMNAYDQADYQTALDYLNQTLEMQPDNQGALFYSGICLLMLEQEQKALPVFQKLDQETGGYRNAAKWYLGLTLLKLDQVEAAKVQLKQLVELNQSSYARQAEKLLIELK